MGYHVAGVAPPGKDGGLGILAFSDPLGTRPPRIKVQVKRQQQSVAVDGLRSFISTIYPCWVRPSDPTKRVRARAEGQAMKLDEALDYAVEGLG